MKSYCKNATEILIMPESKPGKPKGILNPDEGEQQFQLSRFTPSKDLEPFIEHFWIVEWNLGDSSYQQDILSYPSVQLVFERDNTWVWGVVTGTFTRKLEGRGHVLGIKFRPGGFYPFYGAPVSSFADETIAPDTTFDVDITDLETRILAHDNKEQRVERAEHFIRQQLPKQDGRVQQVNDIIDGIIADKQLIKVDQLAERVDMSKRTLQRLFNRYVGVSPKWVIKRFRLHEVAGRLAENQEADLTKLALDLGYYDQAHFINNFKSMIGKTPAEYAHGLNK